MNFNQYLAAELKVYWKFGLTDHRATHLTLSFFSLSTSTATLADFMNLFNFGLAPPVSPWVRKAKCIFKSDASPLSETELYKKHNNLLSPLFFA